MISFQVQTVSISYLRCLIEHVRCYILDRDIELVYYTIRKSSDVLTRDPMQLGAQVIFLLLSKLFAKAVGWIFLQTFSSLNSTEIQWNFTFSKF